MSKIVSTIITVIVTTFVTLAINTTNAYFFDNHGTVRISRPMPVNGGTTSLLSIENDSSKFIDGLVVEVPADVKLSNISFDTSVQLTDSAPSGDQSVRAVKIGQIAPRRVTTLAFSSKDASNAISLRVLNPQEVSLKLQGNEGLDSFVKQAMEFGLLAAIVQGLIVGVAFYHYMGVREHLLDEVKEQGQRIKAVGAEIREANSRYTKQRILLVSRISDYSKELEFWRNTIRGIITPEAAEQLFERVTALLKTYGTTARQPSLDTITIAAGWLRDDEQQSDKKQSRENT
ncbi:hypothetical protein SB861_03570 [Paraburkholderia sp. SIMBA_049]